MASPNTSMEIIEVCKISPPSSTPFSLPLTFFDLMWLRFHPVERLFFYSLPQSHSHPSFFFQSQIPKLKRSLSLALQHFLPLAGNLIWPSDSPKPFVHYATGDGVSVVIATSTADFSSLSNNSPIDATESRSLVPVLESSDSFAAVTSIKITLFPNNGFCIGISNHHAVADGKSSTMFMKAWAYLCRIGEEQTDSSSLLPEFKPFMVREVIKDPTGLDILFINQWKVAAASFGGEGPLDNKSLKILSFPCSLDQSVRATFELSREDLGKLNRRVLSTWDTVDKDDQTNLPKPGKLSTFVLTYAHVSVCISKAFKNVEKDGKKTVFAFTVDCRARLNPKVEENYYGNCVSAHILNIKSEDLIEINGVGIVAKKIYSFIRNLDEGYLDGVETLLPRFFAMASEGARLMGVAGSTRFGVYETDFGWGKPAKVEIVSVDRSLSMGMAERRGGNGGVEIRLVLPKHVMDTFHCLFYDELRSP